MYYSAEEIIQKYAITYIHIRSKVSLLIYYVEHLSPEGKFTELPRPQGTDESGGLISPTLQLAKGHLLLHFFLLLGIL
jgi:hypothetical protein